MYFVHSSALDLGFYHSCTMYCLYEQIDYCIRLDMLSNLGDM